MPFFRARLLLFALWLASPFVCAAPRIFPRDALAISSSSSHSDFSFAEKITIPGIRDPPKRTILVFADEHPANKVLKRSSASWNCAANAGRADGEREAEALGMRVVMIRASG